MSVFWPSNRVYIQTLDQAIISAGEADTSRSCSSPSVVSSQQSSSRWEAG